MEMQLILVALNTLFLGYTDACVDPDFNNSTLSCRNQSHLQCVDENGFTGLHWAAESLDLARVSAFLRHGVNPNAADFLGRTPLHLVASSNRHDENNQKSVAAALLDGGANVNASCRYAYESPQTRHSVTPLHAAVREGNHHLVGLFLSRGANVNARDTFNRTPLHEAVWARWGDSSITFALLKAGADVNAQSQFGNTPLHASMEYDAPESVQSALIEAPGAISQVKNIRNNAGLTPLLITAATGQKFAAGKILAHGDDVFKTDPDGNNALHLAIMNDHPSLAQDFLLKLHTYPACAAASIDNRNQDGNTALELAIRKNYVDLVRNILNAGAQVNLANPRHVNRTPLHFAMEKANPQVVQTLLVCGADVNARDSGFLKSTPYSLVSEGSATAKLLKRHGAV